MQRQRQRGVACGEGGDPISDLAANLENLSTTWTCEPPLYGLDVEIERGFKQLKKLHLVLKGGKVGIFSSW